jgi:hypothetical protein
MQIRDRKRGADRGAVDIDFLRKFEKWLILLVAGDRICQDSRHQTLAFPAIIDLGVWRQSSFVPSQPPERDGQ